LFRYPKRFMSAATLTVTEYCERTSAQFWAEPLNAVSNLAFLVVAGLIAWRLRDRGRHYWDVWLLAGLTAAVGVGSFLWHTLATPWSQWADVIPIGLFVDVFLLSFLVRVTRLGGPGVVIAFLLYQLINYVVQAHLPGDWLNGSVYYLPTLAALLVITVYCGVFVRQSAPYLFAMVVLFTVSLVLRSVDAAICAGFPPGTHFAWHLLNAGVLYLAMRLLSN
jgi:hypothetical protein